MEVGKRKMGEDDGGGEIVVAKKARVGSGVLTEYESKIEKDGRLSSLAAPTMQLVGHESEVFGVEFHPKGGLLASCSFDRTVVLWDMKDENCAAMSIMRGHKSSITDLKWLPDGERVVTASADKTAAMWDVVTAERVKQMKGHSSYVNAVAVARRDHNEPWKVATASDDRTVKIWDRRLKGRNAALSIQHQYQVLAVDFGSNEWSLFSGGIDNDVHWWDLRKIEGDVSEEKLRLSGHTNTITDVKVNPDGTHLVSNGMDNVCKVWDIRPYVDGGDEKRCVMDLSGHRHQVEKNLIRCAWATDGVSVASGSGDRMVWVWNALSGEVLYKLPGHSAAVNDVAFHPIEPILASASSDKTIFLGEVKL